MAKTKLKTATDLVVNDDLEFEDAFYEILADTPKFEVLLFPDESGYYATQEERQQIKHAVDKVGYKLLYKVKLNKVFVVLGRDAKKVGILPENNPHGFEC